LSGVARRARAAALRPTAASRPPLADRAPRRARPFPDRLAPRTAAPTAPIPTAAVRAASLGPQPAASPVARRSLPSRRHLHTGDPPPRRLPCAGAEPPPGRATMCTRARALRTACDAPVEAGLASAGRVVWPWAVRPRGRELRMCYARGSRRRRRREPRPHCVSRPSANSAQLHLVNFINF
jgi:hypothetical protein